MGDVAMTIPVIDSLARQHRNIRITVLTKSFCTPLFSFTPGNVEVIGVDTKNYDGYMGLERLFRELQPRKYNGIADMHNVLRSKFIRTRFWMTGVPVAVIHKGNKSKKKLIGHGIDGKIIKGVINRYADVLQRLGIDVYLDFTRIYDPAKMNMTYVNRKVGPKARGEKWVGVAPFAAHPGKIYPLEQMKQVVDGLVAQGCRVLLFGGGKKEKEFLDQWEGERVFNVCGKMGGLRNEMLLMSKLDCMIAMDSANMHIAALIGIPVVSVWGATHPKMGFAPWNQPEANAIQDLTLPCRPCSVYGNKKCKFGDLRCMTRIQPQQIIDRCMQVMNEPRPVLTPQKQKHYADGEGFDNDDLDDDDFDDEELYEGEDEV